MGSWLNSLSCLLNAPAAETPTGKRIYSQPGFQNPLRNDSQKRLAQKRRHDDFKTEFKAEAPLESLEDGRTHAFRIGLTGFSHGDDGASLRLQLHER